jgi:ribonuclease D
MSEKPPSAKPLWVNTPADLANLVSVLETRDQVAVDTESNSLHAYVEQVCLVQFSIPERDYLVDPLALDDLSPLGAIFSNPAIEKIFHAAEYDVICLKRDFGFAFDNLFDTMLAARILGKNAVGLAALLEDHFGVRMNKRFQRANWAERPLPAEMLDYASTDTHYLIPLRARIEAELYSAGLWELAQEDFRRVTQVNNSSTNGGGSCWRLVGNQHLTNRQAAVLQSLCRFREEQAKRRNVPVFRVLQDDQLLVIAQALPRTRHELEKSCGLSPILRERYGTSILQAVERGKSAEPPPRPQNTRLPEDILERQEALKQWRKDTGRSLGVESDVILPRDVLEELALRNPRSLAEIEKLMESVPWRFKKFGDQILFVLKTL